MVLDLLLALQTANSLQWKAVYLITETYFHVSLIQSGCAAMYLVHVTLPFALYLRPSLEAL
jgi:hypothetical protein